MNIIFFEFLNYCFSLLFLKVLFLMNQIKKNYKKIKKKTLLD